MSPTTSTFGFQRSSRKQRILHRHQMFFFLSDFNNPDSLGECNSAFQRTQDNINVNEISESLTSASSAPAKKNKKKEVLPIGTQDIENSPAPLSGFTWKNT